MTTIQCLIIALCVNLATTAHAGGDHADADAEHAHAAEGPTVAVTQWTDTMELFMEYPVLVANTGGNFIIHLTILDGFQAVTEGTLTLRFRDLNGSVHQLVAARPVRNGIYTPLVKLPLAGKYQFELSYAGPGVTSSFHIEDFVVYGSQADIPAANEDEPAGGITFLKEQQWMIPFATRDAELREVKKAIWAIGEVLPAPTAYTEIIAPADGILQVSDAADLVLPGSHVRRGDIVARIIPPLRGDGWAASQLDYAQAKRNLERARRLRDKEAISEREFEEAENAFLAQQAGYERLADSGEGNILNLKTPIDGQIIDWNVRPGQRLRAGDRLMAVADPGVVWLKVNVYERDFRELGVPVGAYVSAGSGAEGWRIPEDDMRVLTTGGALDPTTRTIPVLLEVINRAGHLTINESTPIELYASQGHSATAVPLSAVYEDEGLDVVFVQTGGESFAKQIVELGPQQAGWVSILSGLQPGDRVVSRGGYHVKLASSSAAIGHGHAH